MRCPNCRTQLETMLRVLYPMEQRDEVRILSDESGDGLRLEFTGQHELCEGPDTQQGFECPACGHDLDASVGDIQFIDTPPPTHESIEITDPDAEARGRNGWFRPAEIAVQRFESDTTIRISVRSSRAYTDMPPIHICIGVEDARRLMGMLGRQVTALVPIGEKS